MIVFPSSDKAFLSEVSCSATVQGIYVGCGVYPAISPFDLTVAANVLKRNGKREKTDGSKNVFDVLYCLNLCRYRLSKREK